MTEQEIIKAIEENAERIAGLPELIAKTREEANHQEEISGLSTRLNDRLIDLETEAGMEVDDAGKKLYTNKDQRAARAREVAEHDDEYKTVAKRLAELKSEKLNADIRLGQLQNELGSRKAIIYGFASILDGFNAARLTNAKTQIQRIKVEV